MKIAVSSRGLKGLLGDVLKLGTGDATHPGFSLLHLEVTKKGAMRATVINAQAAVRMVHVPDAGDFEPGAAAVVLRSAEMVASVLRADDTLASVSTVDAGPGRAPIMRLRADDLLLKFPTLSLDDIVPFPSLPEGADIPWCTVPGATLQAIVKHALWCCEPPTGARPALQGLHMTPAYVEAADGHRLIHMAEAGIVNRECIVPAPMVTVAAQLAGAEGSVRLVVDGNRVWVQGKSFMLTCRTIDGVYPDTSKIYMQPDAEGMTNIAAGASGTRVRVSEIMISQPSLWSAATNMTKIFAGGGKDDRPVLKFLRRDDELSVFMKQDSGTGVDMAQRLNWHAGTGVTAPDEASSKELGALSLDAQYVSQVVGSLPKQDYVQMLWTGSRDRVQMSAGNVRAVIMPRG